MDMLLQYFLCLPFIVVIVVLFLVCGLYQYILYILRRICSTPYTTRLSYTASATLVSYLVYYLCNANFYLLNLNAFICYSIIIIIIIIIHCSRFTSLEQIRRFSDFI